MRFRYWILAMIVSLFASCSDNEALPAENGEEETSDLVTEVLVSCNGFTAGLTRGTNGGDCCSTCNGDCTCACNGACASLTSDGDKKMVKNTCPEDAAYILGMKSFEEGNRIYILQRGPNLTPRFPGDFFDHRNDTDEEYVKYKEDTKKTGDSSLDSIYIYEYYRPEGTVGFPDSIGGYNFKHNPKRSNPISWKRVKENGSIGNSFVFFAFCDNLKDLEPASDDPLLKYWNTTNGQVTASFGPVQYYHHAYGGKWKKSDNVGGSYDYSNDWHVYQYQNHCGVPDFLGAYHTTSSLYERLRFKFHHLLAYVRVTLYVPVVDTYEDTDPKTGQVTGQRTTGFDDTAFVLTNDGSGNGTDAEINDYRAGVSIGNHNSNNRVIRTRFTIDWAANRSTDDYGPVTQTLDVANSAGFLYYYCMYFHNPCDITAPRYKPKTAQEDLDSIRKGIGIEDLDVTKFVENGANAKYLKKDANGKYIDQVRRYEFSAAIPAQPIPTSGTVGGKTATSTLVDIHVRAPDITDASQIYNGTKNNYHNDFAEYTLSTDNFMEGVNGLALQQGTITHLYIYLPRVDDEAILVNAEVLPWKDTHTDMAVSPDDWGDEDNDDKKQ